MKKIAIHWFRQDLRLSDNPALIKASTHNNVLPIYILDDENSGNYALGAASRWWLHYSLQALDKDLNGNLSLYIGNPKTIFTEIMQRFMIEAVYWNRCYEPWCVQRDIGLKNYLKTLGIKVKTYNGSLLWEPWHIKKTDGTPYKLFTPFYRKSSLAAAPRLPLLKPESAQYILDCKQITLDTLELLPKGSWQHKLKPYWEIGEASANKKLTKFIETSIANYKDRRNFPAKPYASHLSPHLHFGEISPNQVWYSIKGIGNDNNVEYFCSELGWREFSSSQLYYNPELPYKSLRPKFDDFPWQENLSNLQAWQTGTTGIPMVDAGMRELWQTGYMHNRARMIVGSFLVKNLKQHWRHGERWFWDTLVDADLANNSTNWQWVAGCGTDAVPYFRIFNPVTQGQKFDADGVYVRQYIPEIAQLPNKYLFSPWEAPELILKAAGVKLGSTYPKPIMGHSLK